MRLISFLSLALANTVTGEMQQVGPGMQKAMSVFKQACGYDVSVLCPDPNDRLLFGPNPFAFEAPHDHIMDLMMNPLAPPPLLIDVTSILDVMIFQALSISSEDPAPVVHVFHLTNDPFEDEDANSPEKILDSMVQTLVEKTTEEPEAVVEKIVQHGNDLLKTGHDEDVVRMARRLTELDTSKVAGARIPLPFGCPKNRCLRSAFEQGLVSPACADAFRIAEETQTTIVRRAAKIEEESQVFIGFSILYVFLVIVTAFLLRKKFRRIGRKMRDRSRIIRLIVQAVYSDPAIKTKIEKAVGEKIGVVPPLPAYMLANKGDRMKNYLCRFTVRMLKLTVFAIFVTLILVDPAHAMFVMCIALIARFMHLVFCPDPPVEDACECCCCALSTNDVKKGDVTAEQACCTCCKGTGVCAPGCAACCDDGDDPCDCCHDGCNCCDGDSKPLVRRASDVVYEGIPIQVV